MVEIIPNKSTEKNNINLETNKFDLAILKNKTELSQELLGLKKTIPGKDGTYYRNDKGTIRTVIFKNGTRLDKKMPAQGAKIYGPNGTFDNARLRGTEAKQVKVASQEEIRSELADYMRKNKSQSEIIWTYKPDPKHPGQYIQTPQIQVVGLEAPTIDPIDIISGAFIGGMLFSGLKTAGRFVLTKGLPEMTLGQIVPQVAKAGAAEVGEQVVTSSVVNALSP